VNKAYREFTSSYTDNTIREIGIIQQRRKSIEQLGIHVPDRFLLADDFSYVEFELQVSNAKLG
jgi:hypothetical protein